ncbi:hypothetical protein SPBR_03208 [Sporothrix brasiliensis 5110]|uniref:Uncharacterized protein n=1 Tax=Sporothrix brasiliensis 5110 TaxID=1398154 RepID=A0A0C2J0J1_9PEZI|nr:uncharacterized protein SPBR_03208 [Sporothrix brasiliensis 5110]KIH92510.1 hypothetical protein SPBR_03208 [Sporothrix brasiliensis 5110]
MFYSVLFAMLLSSIRAVEGTPTYQEEYRVASYVPKYYNSWRGIQVIAPDTPYVAASGPDSLYFIDTRFDNDTAAHIKEQIEWAMLPNPDEHFFIDEEAATAFVRNSATKEVVFTFDPPFARVFFARFMNKQNPSLQLPEHEDGGEWVVKYNLGGNLFKERSIQACSDHGCNSASDCTPHNCDSCHQARVDNECEHPTVNAVGSCKKTNKKKCPKTFDDPARASGETDAAYYARLDALHWGAKE